MRSIIGNERKVDFPLKIFPFIKVYTLDIVYALFIIEIETEAEGRLPDNLFYKSYGFSEDELMDLERYLRNNSFLIWEIARERAGATIA